MATNFGYQEAHPMNRCHALRVNGQDAEAARVLVREVGQARHERSAWLLVAALLFFQGQEFELARKTIGRVDPTKLETGNNVGGMGKSSRELFDFIVCQSRRVRAARRKLSRDYARAMAAAAA